MTATPAAAAVHTHPGGIEHYHEIASGRELRLHLFYGHDDGVGMPFVGLAEVGDDRDELTERHRQAHAGDEAIARGAQLGEAFAGLGRQVPEEAAVRRGGPSGQSSEGELRRGPPGHNRTAPSGPLAPAAQIANSILCAYDALQAGTLSRAVILACLTDDINEALGSYR